MANEVIAAEYCLLWVNWWPMCMAKGEWSSWVQAIGSVAAILWSSRLIRAQHRLELRRSELVKQHDLVEQLEGVLDILQWAAKLASLRLVLGGSITTPDTLKGESYYLDRIPDLGKALDDIAQDRGLPLPVWKAATDARRAVLIFHATLTQVSRGGQAHTWTESLIGGMNGNLERYADEVSTSIAAVEALLKDKRNRLSDFVLRG